MFNTSKHLFCYYHVLYIMFPEKGKNTVFALSSSNEWRFKKPSPLDLLTTLLLLWFICLLFQLFRVIVSSNNHKSTNRKRESEKTKGITMLMTWRNKWYAICKVDEESFHLCNFMCVYTFYVCSNTANLM